MKSNAGSKASSADNMPLGSIPALFVVCAGLNGLVAVAMGAGAAHALAATLDAKAIGWIETGVLYQMIHAVALLGTAALYLRVPRRALTICGVFFIAGSILFSGSLYYLALTGDKTFVHAAPVGGLSFMLGWGALIIHGAIMLRLRQQPDE